MIDFAKEVQEYKPILEIDQIEQEVQQNEVRDLIDILERIASSAGGERPVQTSVTKINDPMSDKE